MTLIPNISGAVLAGGKSSRMGRDKALLELEGETFLERAVTTLRQVVGRVIVVADAADRYRFLHVPVYPDLFPGCGPLGGIHAALTHAHTPATLIVSCDLPLIGPGELKSILRAYRQDITIAGVSDRPQPLCGVYSRSFLPIAEEYLRAGRYRVLEAVEDPRVKLHLWNAAGSGSAFANINTPGDYRRLVAAAEEAPPRGH